jgi:hypothetical protein
MTTEQAKLVERLHEALVEEIRSRRPEYLREPFTVAEIYQELVPYRSYRDRIGAAMNGDYEDALLRLLSGTGGYLVLESEPARKRLLEELQSSNPNTGIFREYAALDVRLNQARIPFEIPPRASSVADNPPPGPPSDSVPDAVVAAPATPSGSSPARLERQMQTPTDERPRKASPAPKTGESAETRAKPAGDASPCRWCREQLPRKEKLRFCPFCGMDVNLVPCRVCGEELEPEWRFCIACGTQVTTED